MSEPNDKRPLKLCCTCVYWSSQYKGFCLRLEQGVGKFWRCLDWSPAAQEDEAISPGAEVAQAGGR
jgi:hypothetical protein